MFALYGTWEMVARKILPQGVGTVSTLADIHTKRSVGLISLITISMFENIQILQHTSLFHV